jgi:predicted nucleic acid-binding Zn ribbon protein
MARSNEVSLGAALESVLTELNLRHGVYEARIEAMWETVMGNTIARHTSNINLKSDRLYLTVDSAALRNELFYSRVKIRDVINKELGKEIVKDVFIY